MIEQEVVMTDHIHLFISANPTGAPTDSVGTLKSISAIELFQAFPQLKTFYGSMESGLLCEHYWPCECRNGAKVCSRTSQEGQRCDAKGMQQTSTKAPNRQKNLEDNPQITPSRVAEGELHQRYPTTTPITDFLDTLHGI